MAVGNVVGKVQSYSSDLGRGWKSDRGCFLVGIIPGATVCKSEFFGNLLPVSNMVAEGGFSL